MITHLKRECERRLGHKIDKYRWTQIEDSIGYRIMHGKPITVTEILEEQRDFEAFVARLPGYPPPSP